MFGEDLPNRGQLKQIIRHIQRADQRERQIVKDMRELPRRRGRSDLHRFDLSSTRLGAGDRNLRQNPWRKNLGGEQDVSASEIRKQRLAARFTRPWPA
ncbi:MAG: hypothetical protein JOZ30_14685 [Hyphomicrobiales bacterium]|nr:hypothetical protein [Hyphomicrobiales bacterium]